MSTPETPTLFERTQGLGGSDVAVLLGLSSFKTPVQLWAEKRGLPSMQTHDESLVLRLGHHLEPFIATEFERLQGLKTHGHPAPLFHPDYPMFYGHIDRFVTQPGKPAWGPDGRLLTDSILECKSANAFARSQWGEEGSDQMPAAYLLQVIWYLAITGCKRAYVAALVGQKLHCYEVYRDLSLEAMVLQKAKHFWDEHIVKGIPPAVSERCDVQLLYPQGDAERCKEADEGLYQILADYRALAEQSRAVEAQAESLKLRLQDAMGEACTLTFKGDVLATWKPARASTRVDLAALSAAHPELVASFKHEVPGSRRFLIKAATRAIGQIDPERAPQAKSTRRSASNAGLNESGIAQISCKAVSDQPSAHHLA
jgi:putative phage-type endonuclease